MSRRELTDLLATLSRILSLNLLATMYTNIFTQKKKKIDIA